MWGTFARPQMISVLNPPSLPWRRGRWPRGRPIWRAWLVSRVRYRLEARPGRWPRWSALLPSGCRGWVISARPAIISEADYVVAQDASAPRGPAGPATRRYMLACGRCGRRVESAWCNGKPAYRCRHGYTSAIRPSPDCQRNLPVREDKILARLAVLAILRAGEGGVQPTQKAADESLAARAVSKPLGKRLGAVRVPFGNVPGPWNGRSLEK